MREVLHLLGVLYISEQGRSTALGDKFTQAETRVECRAGIEPTLLRATPHSNSRSQNKPSLINLTPSLFSSAIVLPHTVIQSLSYILSIYGTYRFISNCFFCSFLSLLLLFHVWFVFLTSFYASQNIPLVYYHLTHPLLPLYRV
jgi:hypothetical protein